MRLGTAAITVLILPVAAGPVLADTTPPRTYVLQFAEQTAISEGTAAVSSAGGRVEHLVTHVFTGAVARLPERAAAALARNPRIARIEPDQVLHAQDAQVGAPWNLDRVDQHLQSLDGTFTWTATGAGVTAYVVDSGIRRDHEDFTGRVAAGYSVLTDDTLTDDCAGHGTHVAGILGGQRHGVAKNVGLVPVRVLDCQGSGTVSGVVRGLDWVVAHHQATSPAVANLSVAAGASDTLDAAVRATIADGITVVTAAGNSGQDACSTSPARVGPAVTVGATDSADVRPPFSNYGACLDLFAPGVDVVSNGHASTSATAISSGTSMAAPHAAGAAAALLQAEPSLSPEGVAERLLSDASSGVITNPGAGSASRLLWANPTVGTTARAATVPSAPTGVQAVAGRRSARVTWTRSADGGSPLAGHNIRVYIGSTYVSSVAATADATSSIISGLKAGKGYTFSVSATNAVGTGAESGRSNLVVPTR